jgi:D-inositol-3-phosphate glycosyltransferase
VKIVVISPAHPLRGGIAASSERLALALQEAGHEVVVYSFSMQYPKFLFPGKTQLTDDPTPAGIVIKTRLHSLNPFNWWRVAREIAAEQADQLIIRFWMPFMGPCLGSVARLSRWFSTKKIRITALVDNIIPHEKRMGDRPLAKYFVGACDDFVVMSKSVGTEIMGFLPANTPQSRVRFAPHPIYDTYGQILDRDQAQNQLNLPNGSKVMLFFGLIRAYKGLDVLLEALSLVALKFPDLHLIIAGECYEDWSPYQQMIDAANLQDRVHLHLRYIPNDEVAVFFSAAHLVVQPYKTATQSGVLQVAYHFERPVVVTNVGGLPEMVISDKSGWIVPPNDPQKLADCIADFFKNERLDRSEQVRSVQALFSWENLVSQLMFDYSK